MGLILFLVQNRGENKVEPAKKQGETGRHTFRCAAYWLMFRFTPTLEMLPAAWAPSLAATVRTNVSRI